MNQMSLTNCFLFAWPIAEPETRAWKPPDTHHGYGVVEQSLPKYDDVHLLVGSDVVEHVESSDGVNGRDDGGKQHVFLQRQKRTKVFC